MSWKDPRPYMHVGKSYSEMTHCCRRFRFVIGQRVECRIDANAATDWAEGTATQLVKREMVSRGQLATGKLCTVSGPARRWTDGLCSARCRADDSKRPTTHHRFHRFLPIGTHVLRKRNDAAAAAAAAAAA